MRKIWVPVVSLALCAAGSSADSLPKGPDHDGTKPALARIAGEGMMNSHAFDYLTELSDEIGSRVTGSPAERKAEQWSLRKMSGIGLENVHLENTPSGKGGRAGMRKRSFSLPLGAPFTSTPWAGPVQHLPGEPKPTLCLSISSTSITRRKTPPASKGKSPSSR